VEPISIDKNIGAMSSESSYRPFEDDRGSDQHPKIYFFKFVGSKSDL